MFYVSCNTNEMKWMSINQSRPFSIREGIYPNSVGRIEINWEEEREEEGATRETELF